jgi:hypothetical protein
VEQRTTSWGVQTSKGLVQQQEARFHRQTARYRESSLFAGTKLLWVPGGICLGIKTYCQEHRLNLLPYEVFLRSAPESHPSRSVGLT